MIAPGVWALACWAAASASGALIVTAIAMATDDAAIKKVLWNADIFDVSFRIWHTNVTHCLKVNDFVMTLT
ncbi:MAG: hypothetical protein DHS20C06_14190 [Hyphobacterium sp.]|nr:MAG: hypothetical protein DHS20C06_14190 [Hyphobacterium sp.]